MQAPSDTWLASVVCLHEDQAASHQAGQGVSGSHCCTVGPAGIGQYTAAQASEGQCITFTPRLDAGAAERGKVQSHLPNTSVTAWDLHAVPWDLVCPVVIALVLAAWMQIPVFILIAAW